MNIMLSITKPTMAFVSEFVACGLPFKCDSCGRWDVEANTETAWEELLTLCMRLVDNYDLRGDAVLHFYNPERGERYRTPVTKTVVDFWKAWLAVKSEHKEDDGYW